MQPDEAAQRHQKRWQTGTDDGAGDRELHRTTGDADARIAEALGDDALIPDEEVRQVDRFPGASEVQRERAGGVLALEQAIAAATAAGATADRAAEVHHAKAGRIAGDVSAEHDTVELSMLYLSTSIQFSISHMATE